MGGGFTAKVVMGDLKLRGRPIRNDHPCWQRRQYFFHTVTSEALLQLETTGATTLEPGAPLHIN